MTGRPIQRLGSDEMPGRRHARVRFGKL
jgi:hypothetical protein